MKYKDLKSGQIIRRRGKGYALILVMYQHPEAWDAHDLEAWSWLHIDKSICHLYEDLGHVLDLLPDTRGEG